MSNSQHMPLGKSGSKIDALFVLARQEKASDLYLAANNHPVLKVHGKLKKLTEYPIIKAKRIEDLFYSVLTPKQQQDFENRMEIELTYETKGAGNIQIIMYLTDEGIGAACRLIPTRIPSFKDIGPVDPLEKIAALDRGLVLITGKANSAKDITIASILDNINTHLQKGTDPLEAAITGTKEVSIPVTFGVLTTMAAFYPLTMIEGVRGQIFAQIPAIVIPVLFFSLVESKLILPAHLKHLKRQKQESIGIFSRLQQSIATGFEQAVFRFYRPFLDRCLRTPLLTLALALATLIVVSSVVFSGWTRFVFFPRVPSETVRVNLTMPAGTAFHITDNAIEHIVSQAGKLREKYSDPASGKSVIKNILSTTGSAGGSSSGQTNRGRVLLELEPPETRLIAIKSTELVREWRKMIGSIAGMESLTMRAEIGRGGSPIDVQLTGQEFSKLKQVATAVKKKLSEFPAVFDIEDSLARGKQELQLQIKPEAQALGLSLADLAVQVRQAFFGYEVQRILRGRDDVRVYIRYPEEERNSLYNLDSMLIRTADGAEVPFNEVADLLASQSPSRITRINQRRSLNITADVDKQKANIEAIKRDIVRSMDELLLRFPSIRYTIEGEAKEQRQSFQGLKSGLILVLFVIYGLLAIPFRSYGQPFIVMSMIPFGAVGAVAGHWLMGKPLTIMRLMGMLALTGVVVNDSLVLVDYINRKRREGIELVTAVSQAGVARFRAVVLTSLTTFAGLTPLIFEKSTQAQFLIPMAISLGFGIMFATICTLVLLPVNYLLFTRFGHGQGIGYIGQVNISPFEIQYFHQMKYQ